MSRSSRHKEKYGNGNELSRVSTNEGSAARTRPISFEEIMSRRKNKKLTDAKAGTRDPDCFSREDDVDNFADDPKHDRGYKHGKEFAHDSAKKATEETVKRSSRKEETTSLKERSSVKSGDKEYLDSEKVKVDYETGRIKDRKNEKHNHHRSRNEEHSQDDNETGKTKEQRKESQSRHRSRIEEHPRDDDEPDKPRKRRNETQSHQRSRNEEYPRDDNEAGKSREQKYEKQGHHRSRNEDHPRGENATGKPNEWKNENQSHHKSRNEQHLREDNETGKAKERKHESRSHHKNKNDGNLRDDNDTGKSKEQKNENQSHYRSRNEEHPRDNNESNKSKERMNENQNHHKSKNEERHRDANETGRMKEHNNGKHSHHRNKDERHLRDDSETKKKHAEQLVGKDAIGDGERVKSEREGKRKYESRDGGKDRSVTDGNAIKNNDSDKYNSGSAERRDISKSHYEGSGQKRRRSRSVEFRDRERSISLSPRANKRAYNVQEHREPTLHSLNDKKQHSDDDRSRVSGNGGHTSNHGWRHGGRGSRLGGYSPRKRRSEAAIKTPSPTSRSPERKSVGWDHPPTGTGQANADVIPDFQLLNQIVSTEHKFSSVPLKPNVVGSLPGASPSSISKARDAPVDAIQLTQSTRPMRTLYVENLPDSASDKSVMEFLNNLLLLSGANHVQGTQPCISCILKKEKGQAVVEFLTAEDTTTALSFDGRSFSSSVLKIRRPKDFVDSTTGDLERSLLAADAISDIVRDSPHKIFVGGISKSLSSDMILEIASAFGRLKAYRYVINDLNEPHVFLEYLDETRTPKACAGLNGMKLGGQILTVVQAVPDASVEENTEKLPFYGIPEHAKPLLSKPTKVLMLKNVFNPEELSSLAGSELEETLEDIRLECARFGTVKSINIVRSENSSVNSNQTDEGKLRDPEGDSFAKRTEILEQNMDQMSTEEASVNFKEPVQVGDVEDVCPGDDKPAGDGGEKVMTEASQLDKPEEDFGEKVTTEISQPDNKPAEDFGEEVTAEVCRPDNKPEEDFGEKVTTEVCQLDGSFATDAPTCNFKADVNPQETPSQIDTSDDKVINGACSNGIKETNIDSRMIVEEELIQKETNEGLQEASLQLANTTGGESETSQREESKPETVDKEAFEQGCVFVEYVRTEYSCIAAHCLHGRSYGDRTVMVSYIPHELYLSRFPK